MKISQALQAIAIVVVAALSAPAEAHANPTDNMAHDAALFCRQLDLDSSVQGVKNIAQRMRDDGLSPALIDQTANYALTYICPEYQDEVRTAIDVLTNKQQLA